MYAVVMWDTSSHLLENYAWVCLSYLRVRVGCISSNKLIVVLKKIGPGRYKNSSRQTLLN